MCIAVPAKIIKIYENQATVNFGGVKTRIDISLVEDLNIGDYVLIHAGCAIQKIDEKEADQTIELFKFIVKD